MTTKRPELRKAAIFEFVERQGKASVEELAVKFSTSRETLRRDLNELANAGRVRKYHGGVRRIGVDEEGQFNDRIRLNTLGKRLIAERLAQIIVPNQSILIDTGSTTLLCAEVLAKIKGLTVITNSTRIAKVFSTQQQCSNVILLGGTYRHDNAQTVGATTIAEIARFRTDHAILTIGTIDSKSAMDYSEEEAQVARAMIDAAAQVTVVVDCSKFNKRSTFHVCDLERIDTLVIDKSPDEALLKRLASSKVDVVCGTQGHAENA